LILFLIQKMFQILKFIQKIIFWFWNLLQFEICSDLKFVSILKFVLILKFILIWIFFNLKFVPISNLFQFEFG
jgi:hypothetical protein